MVTQMLNIREANFNFPMYSISASQSSVHIIGRVFQIAVRGGGLGGIFLPGGKNLRRSDFDNWNLFQS